MKTVHVNYRASLVMASFLAGAVCAGIFIADQDWPWLAPAVLLIALAVWWFVRGALVLAGSELRVRDLLGRTVKTYAATSRKDFVLGDGLVVTTGGTRERIATRLADPDELSALGRWIGPDVGDEKPDDATPPDVFDRAAAWLAVHGPVLAVGLITISIGVIHHAVFHGHPAGDDLTFHYAESTRIADCLRVGDFDFWNPSANGGYASLYYYQEIAQLASAIPAAIFGHHLFWFQLSVWLPHVIAPLCAYRGLRLLGATPWQAAAGAFAVAFTNGRSRWGAGNAGTFQVGLYTQTWALAFMPLALGHAVRWVKTQTGLASATAWSTLVFLCHPFAGIVLGLGLAISVIAGLVPRIEPVRWPSAVGRLAIFVGAFLILAVASLQHPKHPDAPTWAVLCGSVLITAGVVLPVVMHEGMRLVFPDVRAAGHELLRTVVLGLMMVVASLPLWLPLLVDWAGFGGFPHRVSDEVGPGFYGLAAWYANGEILDWSDGWRVAVFTCSLPVVLMFVRTEYMRWLWPPSLLFAVYLGLGPHIGKISQLDIFPAVRFLGSMQILLALGIGVGMVILVQRLWKAEAGSTDAMARRIVMVGIGLGLVVWLMLVVWFGNQDAAPFRIASRLTHGTLDDHLYAQIAYTVFVALPMIWVVPIAWRVLADPYAARTAIAAYVAAVLVLVLVPGSDALAKRVRVLEKSKNNYLADMIATNKILGEQPQGRKQVGPGAENHWWNLLTYADEHVPALLQMGGGGLQASPNYDFLWSKRDYALDAWLYDAPYIVFMSSQDGRIPQGDTIGRSDNYEVRRLTSEGLVSPVQVTGVLPPDKKQAHAEALAWLRTDDPMHDRVRAYAGSGGPGDPPDGRMLRAWRQDSPGNDADIVAEVVANKPSTFVFRESWHPRWHAYIDGNEAPVRRVTPDFPAVDVPAGKHTLELRFERPWWILGSWLAWPAVPLAAWFFQRRARRKREPKIPKARVAA